MSLALNVPALNNLNRIPFANRDAVHLHFGQVFQGMAHFVAVQSDSFVYDEAVYNTVRTTYALQLLAPSTFKQCLIHFAFGLFKKRTYYYLGGTAVRGSCGICRDKSRDRGGAAVLWHETAAAAGRSGFRRRIRAAMCSSWVSMSKATASPASSGRFHVTRSVRFICFRLPSLRLRCSSSSVTCPSGISCATISTSRW